MNAVRYTDRGSVSIQTRRLRQGLSVSIIDTGVGIAPEDQEKIFQDYYQVSNKARTKGKGSGLGLAIVKRIGALLDLKISLKSEVGVGSHFTVLIPARSVQETEEPELAGKLDVLDDTRLRDRDILIVDDDASILDAMAVLLQTWGCHTIRASSPDQVDRLMSHGEPFDLVLLDDMLDDRLSGLDIANKLAAIMPRRRIIMATGNANSARITEIRNAGFKVLIKPVEYTVLLKNLLEALED